MRNREKEKDREIKRKKKERDRKKLEWNKKHEQVCLVARLLSDEIDLGDFQEVRRSEVKEDQLREE